MFNLEQKELLHAVIREKDKEHQRLRTLLQSRHTLNATEVFTVRRNIVTLGLEKTFLIQQANDLMN